MLALILLAKTNIAVSQGVPIQCQEYSTTASRSPNNLGTVYNIPHLDIPSLGRSISFLRGRDNMWRVVGKFDINIKEPVLIYPTGTDGQSELKLSDIQKIRFDSQI